LWFAVTRHPTAEWLAQQMVEAFPWNVAPAYLVRDNDGAYGQAFRRRIRTMGIRDRPTSPRSPWQNAYAERLIGTLRRDCLDHVLIFGVKHLRQILTSFFLLQSDPHAFIAGQGCAAAAGGPAMRNYCRYAHSVRPASSVCADMIFGKDTGDCQSMQAC
jgi:transposase InsO family protein